MTLLVSGCSTTIKSFFDEGESTEGRNEKLVSEDFKEETDVFNKFKEKEIAKPQETFPKVKEGVSKKIIKTKTTEKKKITSSGVRKAIRPVRTKRKIIPLENMKTGKVKRAKVTTTKEEPTFEEIYPEDYPEKLKKHDESSNSFWSDFSPVLFTGEKYVFNITYLGVNTGKITISTKRETQIGDNFAYHVNARVKTADFYSYLYEIDDNCDSYIGKDLFLPLKFSLIQRQSSQDIDDLQLFDHVKMKAYSFYKRVTKKKKKKKKTSEFIPRYFQDPLSVIYFVRGLPMNSNKKYTIPIVNQGKVEVLNAQYEKTEIIKTKLGKKKAFRVKIDTKHEGETIKGGSMIFWYSADDKKMFLKFEAKIKIGSISGEIDSYKVH